MVSHQILLANCLLINQYLISCPRLQLLLIVFILIRCNYQPVINYQQWQSPTLKWVLWNKKFISQESNNNNNSSSNNSSNNSKKYNNNRHHQKIKQIIERQIQIYYVEELNLQFLIEDIVNHSRAIWQK